ncbi:GTP cyclohydrolase FolE2 [Aminobacterium sp. UBA5514]|uniref:GTP cyclohydrolase FolE2 n=1 Tax=Aminobacterium sp. UBA5514 TaxID=1946036 RepID=UPI00258073B6|nr:GTP cyclohydrolase FolE2 [Aminobacterium sp. UBA5514]
MSMRDVQSERDSRRIPIDLVGIRDLSYPIVVLDREQKEQHTVANVSMAVSLPEHYRGTHMSRFIEVLEEFQGKVTLSQMEHITEHLRQTLCADRAEITFQFPYFIRRHAPVTKIPSYSRYDVIFWAQKDSSFDLITTVIVPVQTLCPCSREISEFGAHNQRARIEVAARMKNFVWIEELVEIAERCGSAPLHSLLKREDEKYVTEQAYQNAKFVEDVLRDTALELEAESRISWYRVRVVSSESIHNHDAFAELERHVSG